MSSNGLNDKLSPLKGMTSCALDGPFLSTLPSGNFSMSSTDLESFQ